jgi:transcriptional regulator with XRE-family HTH domain
MSFPQRIKDSREAKELSQTELGRQLGVTRNAISLWEKGKSEPKASTLRKAAVILGVNYDGFVHFRHQPLLVVFRTQINEETQGVTP